MPLIINNNRHCEHPSCFRFETCWQAHLEYFRMYPDVQQVELAADFHMVVIITITINQIIIKSSELNIIDNQFTHN